MNNYQKACNYIKNNQECINTCYVIGPTGPAGPATITVADTIQIPSYEKANVTNIGDNQDVKLVFNIPEGATC